MKIYVKARNGSFFEMDVLQEETMEKVTHKIQDKCGIKPWNVSLLARVFR